MNRIVRLLGFCTVFLLIAISGLFYAQSWLGRQTEALRLEAIEGKRRQLTALIEAIPAPAKNEFDAYIEKLAKVLNVEITTSGPEQPAKAQPRERWSFIHDVQSDETTLQPIRLTISFAQPPESRLRTVQQINRLILLLISLLVITGLVTAILATRPNTPPDAVGSREPFSDAKSEINSLTKLAQISQKQGQALESERIYRRRVEADLEQNQQILTQTLEEKIRLGRNLHDGVIQSLYATGLTLQAAQTQITTAPEAAGKHVETSLGLINQTIREIRQYIEGLSPERLREKTFAQALDQQIKNLSQTHQAEFALKLDEEAMRLVSDEQAAEILHIINESISNSLRHGKAQKITMRLHHGEGLICLSIQDNGRGFSPDKLQHRGHGLDNLAARAKAISANLKISSAPGEGTRITLTLPIKTHRP